MDSDLFWHLSQQRDIGELREHVDQLRLERDLAQWDLPKIKELAEENAELKLRLGLLLRLLIAKGVITAEEFAALLAQARAPTP